MRSVRRGCSGLTCGVALLSSQSAALEPLPLRRFTGVPPSKSSDSRGGRPPDVASPPEHSLQGAHGPSAPCARRTRAWKKVSQPVQMMCAAQRVCQALRAGAHQASSGELSASFSANTGLASIVGREARGALETGATADGEPNGDGGCAMARAARAPPGHAAGAGARRGLRALPYDGRRASGIAASGAASHAAPLL